MVTHQLRCHVSLRDTNSIPWGGGGGRKNRVYWSWAFADHTLGLILFHAHVHNSFLQDDLKNLPLVILKEYI